MTVFLTVIAMILAIMFVFFVGWCISLAKERNITTEDYNKFLNL